MTVSRLQALRAGDDVLLGGELHTVQAVSATSVRLANVVGAVSDMPLAELLASPGFTLASAPRARAPLPPSGLLDGIPEAKAEQARWWERHVVEILTGLLPENAPGAAPKPEYDPARVSLRQREIAKVAELEAVGHKTSLATVKRQRLAYEKDGLWGLVDQRVARLARPEGRVDDRVVEATRKAIGAETNRSTGTVARLKREVSAFSWMSTAMTLPRCRPTGRSTGWRAGCPREGTPSGRPGPGGRQPSPRTGHSGR
jgi:putative transposase